MGNSNYNIDCNIPTSFALLENLHKLFKGRCASLADSYKQLSSGLQNSWKGYADAENHSISLNNIYKMLGDVVSDSLSAIKVANERVNDINTVQAANSGSLISHAELTGEFDAGRIVQMLSAEFYQVDTTELERQYTAFLEFVDYFKMIVNDFEKLLDDLFNFKWKNGSRHDETYNMFKEILTKLKKYIGIIETEAQDFAKIVNNFKGIAD